MLVHVTFDDEGRYRIESEERTIVPGPGPLPAPPVLFLGSLAACAGLFAVDYLRARGLPFAGLGVRAEAAHADDPRRLVDIKVRVIPPGPLPERHRLPLRRAVDLCTLKNTLDQGPLVTAEIEVAVPAA